MGTNKIYINILDRLDYYRHILTDYIQDRFLIGWDVSSTLYANMNCNSYNITIIYY